MLRLMIATSATIGPKPGMTDGVLVGVSGVGVGSGVSVGGSEVTVCVTVELGVGVSVGVVVTAPDTGAETMNRENPGVSARRVTSSESTLTTSVESG
jgi:hypothetical protein